MPIGSAGNIFFHFFVGNEPPVIDEMSVASCAKKQIEMFFENSIYLPVYNSIFFKNKA
jgi:hypothetical protein